jgi:hypothetical protein
VSHHSQLSSKLALLICDRTFCNLEATAQRLVGTSIRDSLCHSVFPLMS